VKRRAYLAGLASGGAAVAGCLGTGGEAVVDVQESVRIDPESGWTERVPDVSDPGGAVSYIVKSEDGPFDVYFFTERAAYNAYAEYVTGGDPERTPPGHDGFSAAAIPDGGDLYVAETADEGARESLSAEGPYWFVVDHSSYRMENPVDEYGDSLQASVDLSVVRERAGL
jgi:hypothetical protein